MSTSISRIKIALLGASALLVVVWLVTGSISRTLGSSITETHDQITERAIGAADDNYVGSETCSACHDAQFKSVSGTKHGKLHTVSSWKGKVVGCESCHGPGKEHAESGDPTKIISFKNMNAKATSETCLACHAGKQSHNNFRRSEHWRNDVGCTDCHTAHGPSPLNGKPGSITFTEDTTRQKPNHAETAMLKSSEPQLCMSCHNETRAQFTKPFHHKVLEGTMNCSDCHNAHGGFETKQTKLGVGADAACIKCHSNKQGPFVFEHGPLKLEGCTACHTPHGSSNPKMLKRPQIRQLCFECHTGISEELAPGVPSRHNQAAMRETQCTVCHSAIHGSNSSRLLFR
jgi:predicted CXXCH cytochrome family protein